MKMMSKLIIREIIPPMLISLVIFTFVFLMRTIAELAARLIEYQYSLGEVFQLLIFSIPWILGYVIPMSFLLGVILGLNRLSSDSEIIALVSGGISAHSLLIPILAIGSVAWLVNTWILTDALPLSNSAYTSIVENHVAEVINSEINPREFNKNFPGFVVFVQDIDNQTGTWKQVFIFNNNDPDAPQVTLSKQAQIIESQTTGSIDLFLPSFNRYTFPFSDDKSPSSVVNGTNDKFRIVDSKELNKQRAAAKDIRAKSVDELLSDVARDENRVVFTAKLKNESKDLRDINLKVDLQASGLDKITQSEEITSREKDLEFDFQLPQKIGSRELKYTVSAQNNVLLEKSFTIKDFKEGGVNIILSSTRDDNLGLSLINPKITRKRTNLYWIEIHKKFALPFTCIIFAFLGMPLGLSSRRGGKAYGYIVGIVIFVAYWGLLSTGERLATYERLSPALGIWMPNIVFGVIALFLFIRRRVEIRLPVLSSFLLRIRTNEDFVSQTLGASPQTDKKSKVKSSDVMREGKLARTMGFPLVLDRYIIKTYLSMFAIVFFAMYTVFTLIQYVDVNNEIQKNNVDPSILVDFFLYQIPETVLWILPISTLMATMISFGLLNKNLEITAFKSSGISIFRLSVPVIILALLVSLLGFYNQDIIIPKTAGKLEEIKSIVRNRPHDFGNDPTNRWILSENQNKIYFFHHYDGPRQFIDEIHLFDINPRTHLLNKWIFAQRVKWNNNHWKADRSITFSYSEDGKTQRVTDNNYILPMEEKPGYFDQDFRPSDQMSYAELSDYVNTLDRYGLSTVREEFELDWKLSFPFLPIVMTLLGLPFAFASPRKGGALAGIFVSIAMVIIYWGMMSLFKALGQTGLLPALLAAWSPNIIFLGIGLLLFSALRS